MGSKCHVFKEIKCSKAMLQFQKMPLLLKPSSMLSLKTGFTFILIFFLKKGEDFVLTTP